MSYAVAWRGACASMVRANHTLSLHRFATHHYSPCLLDALPISKTTFPSHVTPQIRPEKMHHLRGFWTLRAPVYVWSLRIQSNLNAKKDSRPENHAPSAYHELALRRPISSLSISCLHA